MTNWIRTVGSPPAASGGAQIGVLDFGDGSLSLDPNYGLGLFRYARATYNFTLDGGVDAVPLTRGHTIPAGAVIVGGFMRVKIPVTGVGASLAVHVATANDIQTAAAISGAPWSTTGLKGITPKSQTPESTGILLTAPGRVIFTPSGAALTAGLVEVILYWVPT